VLLLLRRLFLFRPRIGFWDASVGSPWRLKRWIVNWVLPRIDHLFALTHWQTEALAAQRDRAAPVDIIGYAVDETFYHPGFNRNGTFVLSVGEDPAHDYATLVTAVQDVAAKVVLKTRRPIALPPDALAAFDVKRVFLSAVQLRSLYADASIVVVPLCPSDNQAVLRRCSRRWRWAKRWSRRTCLW
jgi:hypothetical protein